VRPDGIVVVRVGERLEIDRAEVRRILEDRQRSHSVSTQQAPRISHRVLELKLLSGNRKIDDRPIAELRASHVDEHRLPLFVCTVSVQAEATSRLINTHQLRATGGS
jgi:hypothetical protein